MKNVCIVYASFMGKKLGKNSKWNESHMSRWKQKRASDTVYKQVMNKFDFLQSHSEQENNKRAIQSHIRKQFAWISFKL